MAVDFDPADRERLARHGLSVGEAARQLHLLRQPPRPFALVRPCTIGDGVRQIGDDERERLVERFRSVVAAGRAMRFVPASGAATRMFRSLSADPADEELSRLRDEIAELPFHHELVAELDERGLDLDTADDGELVDALLGADGLALGSRPKGMIPFHRSGETVRTAFEEHLVEAAHHLTDGDGLCRLHFTVTSEWLERCRQHLDDAAESIGEALDVDFDIGLSVQSPATDTVALAADGSPFRNDDGSLLLRPGGHGALLDNLAALDADLVLVKNVDNVLPDDRQAPVIDCQETLGGIAVELQEAVHEHLRRLREGVDGSERSAHTFLVDELGVPTIDGFDAAPVERRRPLLVDALDRPLRVCGVVENEGEPGGGPFWVERPGEPVRRQIVEEAEVPDDAEQEEIFSEGTHFNPVQIVCTLRDADGRSYDLSRFVDESAVFVTTKSHDGRRLRALERPGLWNGAMAGWITVFVEVPAETFAPVKTVFDLLRPAHRAR